jgi:hypothetical protein
VTRLYLGRLVAMTVLLSVLALSGHRSRAADVVAGADTAPLFVDVDFGPGAFNLPVPTIGLAALASYRATLTRSFQGTRAGMPETWSQTYVMLVNRNPAARQFAYHSSPQATTQAVMTEMNGALYQLAEGVGCTASVIRKDLSLAKTREPAGFLSSLIGAEAAGSKIVNGVAATHYIFDERALGQAGVAKSTGELWVAADGGYVVKYTLVTNGSQDYFGGGAEGTITWDYELTDVNQAVDIRAPDECPSGLVDAPVIADATSVVKLPGALRYTTITTMGDAKDFYQKQLPTQGWQPTSPPSVERGTALMDFSKEGQQMTVMITAADGRTRVLITLESMR